MLKEKILDNKKLSLLFGNENTSNKFPLLNKIIAVYVAVTLVLQVSAIIAPVLTFLSSTPLYHFKTYLGILGALLILADLFTNKVLWRGLYCYLWYGIFFISILSSIRTISLGVSDNLFKICWVVIETALFYSLSYRFDNKSFKKYIFILSSVLTAIWFVACLISIYQFAANISYSYLADLVSEDKTLFIQGFTKNRLYGIFNPLNHAAYISLMLSTVNVYFIAVSKKLYIKIPFIISSVFFIFHIVLSGSRSALVAIFAEVFVCFFLITRNIIKQMNILKFFMCFLCGMLAVILAVFSHSVIKDFAVFIPKTYSNIANANNDSIKENNTQSNTSKKENEFKDILDRDIGSDSSNSRFEIWGNYLSCYKDIGVIGLSMGNYMQYIIEKYPDLYIVDSMKKYHKEKYEAGIIYHVHNGYLMVFVATGILGFILFLIYIILCLKLAFKYLFTVCHIPAHMITLLSLVISSAVAAMFDRGIFLSDNPQSFIFWIAMGLLMKITLDNSSNKEKNYEH